MDRPTTGTDAHAQGSWLNPHEAFVLRSRRPGLDLCRATLRAGAGTGAGCGPILVTGDAGVGKTWLWRRLQAESPPSCRWIGVDLTPANDPSDFYRLIAHELGLVDAAATPSSRVDLVDFLAERQADGERLVLVVEEAHNLSMPVWEEVRVLGNRLDRPGGFSSTLLVGQTSLVRRFSTRPFASIEARLACRVHLGPIDVDEARELLTRFRPDREWSMDEVEIRHRDGAGNPRRMLRKLGLISVNAPLPSTATKTAQPAPLKVSAPIKPVQVQDHALAGPAVQASSSVSLTGPIRPPIQVDDNMIEVGWSPDDLPDSGEAETDPNQSKILLTSTATGEEAVHDQDAARQAWREWSENQARRSPQSTDLDRREASAASESSIDGEEVEEDEDVEEEVDALPSALADRTELRAEGEQKFAPFTQLFSRMAQVREPE
jgi:AAA domain